MSFFISFEGIEGCGKSTQIQYLAEHLSTAGMIVLKTREPGGCSIADNIRSILLDPVNRAMVPRAELLLYAAARAQHVEQIIRPALDRGEIVLCDRFMDATSAYQGSGRGLDQELIEDLNRTATGGLEPDLTLLLDLQVETGLTRARARNADKKLEREGRFELEELTFHNRVRAGYLSLAQTRKRVRRIDASGTPAEVAGRIAAEMDHFLAKQDAS